MSRFNAYPNRAAVHYRSQQVCRALDQLSKWNIQVAAVDFLAPDPVITVLHCPGVQHVPNHTAGQQYRVGINSIKHEASVCGCKIIWSEPA